METAGSVILAGGAGRASDLSCVWDRSDGSVEGVASGAGGVGWVRGGPGPAAVAPADAKELLVGAESPVPDTGLDFSLNPPVFCLLSRLRFLVVVGGSRGLLEGGTKLEMRAEVGALRGCFFMTLPRVRT